MDLSGPDQPMGEGIVFADVQYSAQWEQRGALSDLSISGLHTPSLVSPLHALAALHVPLQTTIIVAST